MRNIVALCEKDVSMKEISRPLEGCSPSYRKTLDDFSARNAYFCLKALVSETHCDTYTRTVPNFPTVAIFFSSCDTHMLIHFFVPL